MRTTSTIIFLFISFLCITFAQKDIDTFNILFPEAYKQTSGKSIQLVTTQGGCFDWSSSSPDIITVTGISSDQTSCHRKGIVQLKHVGSYPASVYVTATNTQTQQLSNIPVRIRPIVRIQIIAKSKLMNINQIQDLSIFAYDKDQNMFTSLQGLKFEWQLVDNLNVLSKISLKNSHLILPLNQRKNIQMKGAESDILVIKGDSPGKAIVRVRCIQPGYQQLKHQITVSVNQRFDIFPALPTYLMVDSQFKFGLITPSRQQISIPKSYYRNTLSSPNFRVADNLMIQTPSRQDQTVLKVQDIRTVPAYSADVTIYAKQPTSIVLNVDQYLIVGEQTNVDVQFYWNKYFLSGKNTNYRITTDLLYNQTKQTVLGKQRTTASIKATYKNLTAQKKITVVLPLKQVLPSNTIVLPLQQNFELKVIGGSGIYEYTIENDIASISGSGVITSRRQGQTRIIVVDKKVPRNKLVLELIVSNIANLSPLQTQKQLNVNEFGPIYTIGKNKDYKMFTKCSGQKILLETSHLSSFEVNNNMTFGASIDYLQSKMVKSTLVKTKVMQHALLIAGVQDFVSKFDQYVKVGDASREELRKYAEQLQNFGICSVNWIKSYQKYDAQMDVYYRENVNVRNKFALRVYDKISNDLGKQKGDSFIMTPLSSLEWKTLGGSYKWQSKTRTLINQVEYQTQYPTITCPESQSLLQMRLTKLNPQSQSLLFPVNQSRTIYIQCKYPSQLKIKYEKQVFDQSVINGLEGEIVKGQLIPYDNKGEEYYNSSNLVYEVEKTAGGNVKLVDDKFEFDSLGAKNVLITFLSNKISSSLKNKFDKNTKLTFNKISVSFNYHLHEMFSLLPHPQNNYLLTLYNPKQSLLFNLTKISDKATVDCQGAVSCTYMALSSNKQVRVNTTKLGFGTMTIVDKSIYKYPSLTIKFQVVDADQIVLSIDKNTVQVHKKVMAEVKMFYQNKVIPNWQYDFRNLLLVHEAGLRSKQILSTSSSGIYQISTQKPGQYKLIAEQHYPRYVQSSPVVLKVYPKFYTSISNLQQSYTPQDILLFKGQMIVAVNCVRRIHLFGGPDLISVNSKIGNNDNLQVKYEDGANKQVQIYGLQEGKTSVLLTVTSTAQNGLTVALIQLEITVKPIQMARLYSLQDAIINAQFRVIPHLIVDDRVLIDSVCDLEYKWSSGQNIRLQGLNKKRLGVNATAVKEGESYIKLEVLKNGQLLFTSTQNIMVHKSLDYELPTVIGQRQNAISANLLIPPNSGLTLQSDIYATKISQCDQNMLSINQNKLITSRQKGMVSIKLQKTNDNSYNNYMNVIVTQIKALFIQNSNSQVVTQLNQPKLLPFYVQDMYGRLFTNDLFNVNYEVISSNEDVFGVELDSGKKFIRILPKKQGEGQLILKLKSSADGSANLGKLLQIPHDIVNVQVGKIIQPQSPIYLAVGGQVELKLNTRQKEQWKIVSGENLVKIDQGKRKITGLRSGQSLISIGGSFVTVRVLDLIIKHKIVSKPVTGKIQATIQYIAKGKFQSQQILLPSITNTYNHVNNHLNLSCTTQDKKWFNTYFDIVKIANDYDKFVCRVVVNNDIEVDDQMPEQLIVSIVSKDYQGSSRTVHQMKLAIPDTFLIPKKSRTVLLSPQKHAQNIYIRTPSNLDVQLIGGNSQWIDTQFSKGYKTLAIKINVQTQQSNNFDFKIRLSNQQTKQTEQIVVKYIVDESKRRAQAEQRARKVAEQMEVKQGESIQQTTASTQMFSGWHWTDFIILIMAVNFILILLYQACMNGDNKYHNL